MLPLVVTATAQYDDLHLREEIVEGKLVSGVEPWTRHRHDPVITAVAIGDVPVETHGQPQTDQTCRDAHTRHRSGIAAGRRRVRQLVSCVGPTRHRGHVRGKHRNRRPGPVPRPPQRNRYLPQPGSPRGEELAQGTDIIGSDPAERDRPEQRLPCRTVAIYKTLDRATLERLYVIDGLSLKEVAARLGPPATKRIVQRALQLHGIPLRPATPPARKQELMSRELLERLYVDDGRPVDEITEIVGVSRETVLARMRRLGIEQRTRSSRRVGDRQPRGPEPAAKSPTNARRTLPSESATANAVGRRCSED